MVGVALAWARHRVAGAVSLAGATAMNGFELKLVLTILAVFGMGGLFLLSSLTFRYWVTSTHLVISWLGLPVRRLRLQDIKRIGTRPVFWAERWPNSWDR